MDLTAEQPQITPEIPPELPTPKRQYPQYTRQNPSPAKRREARRLYIHGEGSVLVIAQRLLLSHHTVKQWSDQEDWLSLREEYDARQKALELGPPIPPPPKPEIQDANPQCARLSSRLKAIEEQMENESDPNALSKLGAAHKALFHAYCTLAGIQSPGVRKSNRRAKESVMPISPMEPDAIQPSIEPITPQAVGSGTKYFEL